MKCPYCESENVQKFSVVYKHGTYHGESESNTYGTFFGSGGSGFGSAYTRTQSVNQSIVAQETSPPSKKDYKWAAAIIIGVLMIYFASYPYEGFKFIGALLILIGGFVSYRAHLYNKNVYPVKYDQWRRSWICNKCGDAFVD